MASDYFIKKCINEEYAKAEFGRTKEIYKMVSETENLIFKVPMPLKVEGEKIFFERIKNATSLRKMTYKIGFIPEALYDVGKILGQLHILLNKKLNSLSTINIHGDFWTSNIFVSKSNHEFYLIDFAPPKFNIDNICHGTLYEDLSPMIISLEIKYPLYKPLALMMPNRNKKMSANFLRGYMDLVGFEIDEKKLALHLIYWLENYKKLFMNKNLMSKLFWGKRYQYCINYYKNKGKYEI